MKKIIVTCLLAFLLVGCSSGLNAKISNSNEVIWSHNGKNFTSSDLNDLMKAQDYTSSIMTTVIEKIAKLENIDTDAIKADAEKEVQDIIDQGYESYIDYYYGSKDSYMNTVVSNGIVSELLKAVANETYEASKAEYLPYKAEIAYFDNADDAKKVIDAANAGENTFAYACSVNGYTGEVTPAVYTDSSDLPVEVKETILNTDTTGLSQVIQSSTYATDAEGNSTITPRYYVVNIISREADEFKDEYIDYMVNNELDEIEVLDKYLAKYNFEVHDQRTYDLLKQTYGSVK